MISKYSMRSLAVAAGLAFAIPAHASFTLSNADGSFAGFTGFDWSALGTAYTQGFVPISGDVFTLNYFSSAVSFSASGVQTPSGMDVNPNGLPDGKLYEYTIVASIQEQISSCNAATSTCAFDVIGGTWTIYYDTAPDANHSFNPGNVAATLGTGYTDGVVLMSGTWLPQNGGTFTSPGGTGFGVAFLDGVVTYTNPALLTPAADGTWAFSTLQLNLPTFGWVNPGGFDGSTWVDLRAEVVFQADANQSFVPEPGVIGLLGFGLMGMGATALVRRRRNLV